MNVLAVYDRVGASMRRAPYVWLTTTLLLMLLMNSALRTVLMGEKQSNSVVAIGAALFGAYSILVWVLWPRMASRAKKSISTDGIVVVRWVFASMPYWVGLVAVILGGRRWCYGFGFVVSVVLLVLTARWVRKLAT